MNLALYLSFFGFSTTPFAKEIGDADLWPRLWWFGIDGLSYAELAEVLGVPTGTVCTRLRAARARLLAIVDARSNARIHSADAKPGFCCRARSPRRGVRDHERARRVRRHHRGHERIGGHDVRGVDERDELQLGDYVKRRRRGDRRGRGSRVS